MKGRGGGEMGKRKNKNTSKSTQWERGNYGHQRVVSHKPKKTSTSENLFIYFQNHRTKASGESTIDAEKIFKIN